MTGRTFRALPIAAALLSIAVAASAQIDPVQILELPGESDSWTAILGAANMDLDPADEVVVVAGDNQIVILDSATGQVEWDSAPYGWTRLFAPGWNTEEPNPGYGGQNSGFHVFCDEDGDGIHCAMFLVSVASQYVRDLAVVCLDRGQSAAPEPLDRSELLLRPNRPNPFDRATRIDFTLERTAPAVVRIYDAQGRLVNTLHDGALAAGDHSLVWNGRRDDGRIAASGTYFFELETEGVRTSRKAVLLR